jgi:biopolymer transport protein ExbD
MLVKILIVIFGFLIMHQLLVQPQTIEGFLKKKKKTANKTKDICNAVLDKQKKVYIKKIDELQREIKELQNQNDNENDNENI